MPKLNMLTLHFVLSEHFERFFGKNKLTIIIPTYNSSEHIKRCLDSITTQKNAGGVEVLCVDGASTDKTVKIIKDCALQNPYIKFTSEKDSGIYDAMNKGINNATGEWLYFLGSDDTLHNKYVLKALKKYLKNPKIDIIYGNVNAPHLADHPYDGKFDVKKIVGSNICHQAIFFRKQIFDKIGKFDQKYKLLADWEFNLRWMINKKIKRVYIDMVIADYASGAKVRSLKIKHLRKT